MHSILKQDIDTSRVFGGKGKLQATKLLYTLTPKLFAKIIKKHFKPGNYTLVDFGSFKGELLKKVLAHLNNYSFNKTAVDINEAALKENVSADVTIHSNLSQVDLKDRVSDVTIARYILVWNPFKTQKKILSEITRITKEIVILQHSGADSDRPQEWRTGFKKILNGKYIPKLKRTHYFFSSREEIEHYLRSKNLRFERILEKKIPDVLDSLAERFQLTTDEYTLAKKLLSKDNYIVQTTWVIFGDNH